MFNKRQRLDHIDMNILPKEVWCIIFSYLDEKSIRSSSATCKLWFELIRSDLKISSHICLVNDDLKEFKTKLEKSEWMWERWPVLKRLELGPLTICGAGWRYLGFVPEAAEEAMDIVKSINFKQCETLEKVIFSVKFDLSIGHSNNREYFYKKYHCLATVEQLTFNPKVKIKLFEIEHVSRLVLSFKNCRLESNKDIICQGLQLIGEKAKCLKNLTINIDKWVPNVHNLDMAGDLDFLKNGFCSVFKGLNDSLETIIFRDKNDNYKIYNFEIFKCLREQNFKNLINTVVMTKCNTEIQLQLFQNRIFSKPKSVNGTKTLLH